MCRLHIYALTVPTTLVKKSVVEGKEGDMVADVLDTMRFAALTEKPAALSGTGKNILSFFPFRLHIFIVPLAKNFLLIQMIQLHEMNS